MLVENRRAGVLLDVGAVFGGGQLVALALGVVEHVQRFVFIQQKPQIDVGCLGGEEHRRAIPDDFEKQQRRDDDYQIGSGSQQHPHGQILEVALGQALADQ